MLYAVSSVNILRVHGDKLAHICMHEYMCVCGYVLAMGSDDLGTNSPVTYSA